MSERNSVPAEVVTEMFALRGDVLVWKRRPRHHFCNEQSHNAWNTKFPDKPVAIGMTSSGYGNVRATVGGRTFHMLQHRVIWCVHHGRWPTGIIDHLDGNPANNAISNLRDTDAVGNGMNARKRRDNTSGVTGVQYHAASGRWRALIAAHGRKQFLGQFKSKEDAVAARLNAQSKMGFGPMHGVSQ